MSDGDKTSKFTKFWKNTFITSERLYSKVILLKYCPSLNNFKEFEGFVLASELYYLIYRQYLFILQHILKSGVNKFKVYFIFC